MHRNEDFMKRLMMYLKDYKKESILAPLFKLLEAFFELLVPLVMANIIDYGISNRNMGYIGKMGLLLLLLGVVGLASSITAQFFAAKAAVGFSTQLRQALFDHIEDLSFTDIDKAGTSTMITRMTSDVNQVQSGINMTLRLFLRSPIIVFGAMIMAFTIDLRGGNSIIVRCGIRYYFIHDPHVQKGAVQTGSGAGHYQREPDRCPCHPCVSSGSKGIGPLPGE